MKVMRAIEIIKNTYPNQYSDEMLLEWLSALDGQVWQDLLAKYGAPAPFLPYRRDTLGIQMAIPFPHDQIYVTYLGAQIDYHNAEFERYNNKMMLFNAQLQEFYDAFTRSHTVKESTVIQGVKML